MTEIKVGDRVRVKDRTGWPSPPGYKMANAEGTIIKWVEYEEPMEEFRDFFHVKLEKAFGAGEVYIGSTFVFRMENLEKI